MTDKLKIDYKLSPWLRWGNALNDSNPSFINGTRRLVGIETSEDGLAVIKYKQPPYEGHGATKLLDVIWCVSRVLPPATWVRPGCTQEWHAGGTSTKGQGISDVTWASLDNIAASLVKLQPHETPHLEPNAVHRALRVRNEVNKIVFRLRYGYLARSPWRVALDGDLWELYLEWEWHWTEPGDLSCHGDRIDGQFEPDGGIGDISCGSFLNIDVGAGAYRRHSLSLESVQCSRVS